MVGLLLDGPLRRISRCYFVKMLLTRFDLAIAALWVDSFRANIWRALPAHDLRCHVRCSLSRSRSCGCAAFESLWPRVACKRTESRRGLGRSRRGLPSAWVLRLPGGERGRARGSHTGAAVSGVAASSAAEPGSFRLGQQLSPLARRCRRLSCCRWCGGRRLSES